MLRLFNRVSIRGKFIAGFSAAFIWTLLLGSFAVERLNAVERAAAEVRDNALQATVALSRLGQNVERLRSVQELLANATAIGRRDALVQDLDPLAKQVQAAINLYRPIASSGTEQQLAHALNAAWATYQQLSDQFVAMTGQVQPDLQTGLLNGRMLKAMDQFRDALGTAIDFTMRAGQDAAERAEILGRAARLWIATALAFSLVFCIAGGWIMITVIAQPITGMSGIMRRLARTTQALRLLVLNGAMRSVQWRNRSSSSAKASSKPIASPRPARRSSRPS